MAILVAVGGAALGSAIGIGASAGWLVGSVVGNLLFPRKGPDIVTEGPRLGDLTVTSSAYGAPIGIGYGTLRMSGNMIWSAGIREQKNVSRTRTGGKGGGGGGSQTTVTYSYFASFALAFGEGPAEDVLRIWADGKLIYDKTGQNADVAKSGLNFRFYPGDDEQIPDGLIESHVGAGQAPAHRGICYVVFEDLPLADYGNRIPNITAEITFRKTDEKPYQLLDFITTGEGGYFGSYQVDELAVDWRRGYGYFVDSDVNAASAGIRRFDLRTMREDRQARMSDVAGAEANFPSTLFVGVDGHLYLTVDSGNSRPLIRVDPNALEEVGRFGFSSIGLSNSTTRFVATSWLGMVSAYGIQGRVDFLLTGSIFDDVGLLRADTMGYVWGAGQTVDEARVRGGIGGKTGEGFGEGWVLGSGTGTNHGQLALYRITVSATAAYDALIGGSLGVTWEKLVAFAPADIEAGATGFYEEAGAISYDATDDSVIFQVRVSNGGSAGNIYTVKYRGDVGIVWKTVTPVQINYEGPFFGQSRLHGQRWSLIRSTRVVQLATATGALVLDETWPGAVDEWGAQVYDSVTDTLLVRSTSGWARLFLNRGGGAGEVLSAIVADLCDRAGLGLADLDAAELTDVVPGYVIGRQSTVRGAIEPLANAWFFDGVESDDVLRFRKRGRAPVATLLQQDLVPLDEERAEAWRERRTQEVELPERVSVLYMDRDADYQQGAQSDKRAALPVPTMHSRDQVRVDLPIALDATSAKRIASQTLYAAWIERSSYEGRVPWTWLLLEPTDVVDVTLDSGAVFRSRIVRTDVGADFSIDLRAVSEDAPAYVSTVVGDAGAGVPVQVIGAAGATRLFLLDLPLLRDVDDMGGAGSRVYYLMAGYGPPGWPGASLYKSADGSSWTRAGTALNEAAWGATAKALGDPPSPFATDETNTLTVFMTTGEQRLESVTQLEMLNGANAAIVVKSNGEPEIIQFRDVTQNPDGSYLLSGLLRGRRGTDAFAAGHQAGELFVLLDADDVEATTLGLGELDLSRSWRGVGFGTLFEDAETETVVNTGRDLAPYAPVHLAGGRNGGGDLTITWVRRTRIGGDWRDGTGQVPLGEASESYELDVLDAPGGAVVRTITGLASPTAVYTAADQTADFGAPQSLVHVTVTQMSAVAGRGFPATASL